MVNVDRVILFFSLLFGVVQKFIIQSVTCIANQMTPIADVVSKNHISRFAPRMIMVLYGYFQDFLEGLILKGLHQT